MEPGLARTHQADRVGRKPPAPSTPSNVLVACPRLAGTSENPLPQSVSQRISVDSPDSVTLTSLADGLERVTRGRWSASISLVRSSATPARSLSAPRGDIGPGRYRGEALQSLRQGSFLASATSRKVYAPVQRTPHQARTKFRLDHGVWAGSRAARSTPFTGSDTRPSGSRVSSQGPR